MPILGVRKTRRKDKKKVRTPTATAGRNEKMRDLPRWYRHNTLALLLLCLMLTVTRVLTEVGDVGMDRYGEDFVVRIPFLKSYKVAFHCLNSLLNWLPILLSNIYRRECQWFSAITPRLRTARPSCKRSRATPSEWFQQVPLPASTSKSVRSRSSSSSKPTATAMSSLWRTPALTVSTAPSSRRAHDTSWYPTLLPSSLSPHSCSVLFKQNTSNAFKYNYLFWIFITTKPLEELLYYVVNPTT